MSFLCVCVCVCVHDSWSEVVMREAGRERGRGRERELLKEGESTEGCESVGKTERSR